MDIESLAKELILKNMNPEQQLAVLEGIKTSVAQAKEVQKQRIGENVGLVVDALKKIESDIRSRFDEVGTAIEHRVNAIKDGRDGINGQDGKNGKDGRDGKQGVQGVKGKDGRDGRDGVDGVDGVSVTSAHIDFDGSLIIGLSSGVELNVGEVLAPSLAESIKVITNGGGTSQSVIDTLASLQTQINNLIPSQTGNSGKYLTTNGTALSWASIAGGGLSYQGTWNASTNSPTLTSSTGTNGYYYIVATAGSTNLNGITDWKIGDWLLFNGTVWQKIDQSETLQSITSTDGSVTVTTTNSTVDLAVAVAASTTNVVCYVRNTTGATLTKGTAVYISGATGQNPTVSKALATGDSTSAQTLGLMSADLANNSNGYVTVIGLLTNMDTSAYTDGAQLYLSGTTAGTLTATKTYAPTHLVYVAVVEHAHPTQGKLFVKVQNGYELDEIHNVSAQSPSNGQTIIYNATTSLWEKGTLTAGTGISVTNGAGSITVANTGVTSVTGTSPVVSSGGATPAISLASGYGDTLNPYASKTANYVLAAPNGSAGAPTFRAVVAADIPTLNQNTTGTASNVTGTVALANGGTGQITASAAFNALSPVTTTGDLIVGNGVNSSTRLAIGTNGYVLTSNGTTASWSAASSGGVSSFSAGTTGLTPSTATTGVVTLAGTLIVGNGGTGSTTASGARTNLGLVIGTDVLSPSGSGASLTSLNATNLSSGTVAKARLPTGCVLQVVQTAKTDTFTTSSAMPTFVDITGLSASITPTSSSSKVLVTVTGVISNAGTNYCLGINLVRGSTSIAIGDARGSTTRCFGGGVSPSSANTITVTVCFLDSPATTSATTYKVQLATESGGTALIGGAYRSDLSQVISTPSIITLQEISA